MKLKLSLLFALLQCRAWGPKFACVFSFFPRTRLDVDLEFVKGKNLREEVAASTCGLVGALPPGFGIAAFLSAKGNSGWDAGAFGPQACALRNARARASPSRRLISPPSRRFRSPAQDKNRVPSRDSGDD